MKKRAFTLIELLAVIAVLGMLTLIVVPIMNNVVQNSKMNSYKASVNSLLRTLANNLNGLEGTNEVIYTVRDGVITPNIEYEGEINGNGFIKFDYLGKSYVQIYDGQYCIYKSKPQSKLNVAKMTSAECNEAVALANELTLVKGVVTTDSINVVADFSSNKVAKEYYFAITTTNNPEDIVWVNNEDKTINYYTFRNLTSRTYTILSKVITTDDEEIEASLMVPSLVNLTANITLTPTTWSQNKTVNIDFGVMNRNYTYRYRIGNQKFINISVSPFTVSVLENNTNFVVEVLDATKATIFSRAIFINNIDTSTPMISSKNSQITVGKGETINLPGNYFNIGAFGASGGNTTCRIGGVIYANTKNLDVGNYTLICSTQLNNGTAPVNATTNLKVIDLESDYAVSEDKTYQEFTARVSGYYRIELWGASGGNSRYNTNGSGKTVNGGKGAYTSGQVYLNSGEKLYIYVGEKGNDGTYGSYGIGGFNGGGRGGNSNQGSGGGGGATDVRYFSSTPTAADLAWNSTNGLNARIMVAAGGGGASNYINAAEGGDGGALYGENGILNLNSVSHTLATGGTQSSAGTAASNASAGAFGIGGNGHSAYSGGGGGGWYGGGGGGYVSNGVSSGAGGSSFISGYAGVNAITSTRTHTLKTVHFSGKYFKNTKMTAGVNNGNGKVNITYVSSAEPTRINNKLNNVKYIMDCTNGNSLDAHNVWVELQAIYNGTNIAKGKVVTGTSPQTDTAYPYSRLVDGEINCGTYTYSTYDGMQCVIVDLADEYDLDEVAAWHYFGDFRALNNNYTYVSTNNVDWTLILKDDSNQTASGNRINAYNNNEVSINSNVTWNLNYVAAPQIFVVPETGYYQVELWGAQGGSYNATYPGGKGSYTSGIVQLIEGQKLYFYVGESGGTTGSLTNGFNGGGDSLAVGSYIGYRGGGATDVRYFLTEPTTEDLADDSVLGLNSRIMVAAGGGGSGYHNNPFYSTGGAGGTLEGLIGTSTHGGTNTTVYGPATQVSGGYSPYEPGSTNRTYGGFGYGGSGSRDGSYGRAGGGSGYYGGSGGPEGLQPGNGGSSYISGYQGCVAIAQYKTGNIINDQANRVVRTDSRGYLCNTSSALSDIVCSYHYSGMIFHNPDMKSGIQSMKNHGDNGTIVGNAGHGYAKITLLGDIEL